MSENKTLCIVGLGLVGGSLAASVKARGLPWNVRAVDRRRSALEFAQRNGFIDDATEELHGGVDGADLIVLAAPVRAIRRHLGTLSGLVRPGQMVTDVGSTKTGILQEARGALPPGVEFVGGHPVTGTERSGVERAGAGLFEGKTCVLTPDPTTSRQVLEVVTELWRSVGAEVVYMDPATHDRTFALVSHLPHVVAYGVIATVAGEIPKRDTPLGARSLWDFSRVTRSSPAMWSDVYLENRDFLVEAIDAFGERLNELRSAIASGDEGRLGQLLERAAEGRGTPWTR